MKRESRKLWERFVVNLVPTVEVLHRPGQSCTLAGFQLPFVGNASFKPELVVQEFGAQGILIKSTWSRPLLHPLTYSSIFSSFLSSASVSIYTVLTSLLTSLLTSSVFLIGTCRVDSTGHVNTRV